MKAFYHEDYYFPLPEGHPFQMGKFPEGREIVGREARGVDIVETHEATEEELSRVHSRDYLRKVREGSWLGSEAARMGLPIDDRLYRRCALEVGGSIEAGFGALDQGLSTNLGGGTHHADFERASGYCIFNDVAVAIKALRRAYPDLWTMVIDTDAHQGDGTHSLFANDRRTFTYSIHVGKNFPAKKVEGDCDVPLERWVSGEAYLDALRGTLEESFLEFEPDLVFWVAGADVHAEDRFGQMKLTEKDIRSRNEFVIRLVRGWNVPLAIVYGGGYNRNPDLTNQLHALPVIQAAAEHKPPKII